MDVADAIVRAAKHDFSLDLRAGLKPNGQMALHFAVSGGNAELVELLLNAGCGASVEFVEYISHFLHLGCFVAVYFVNPLVGLLLRGREGNMCWRLFLFLFQYLKTNVIHYLCSCLFSWLFMSVCLHLINYIRFVFSV
jgi:hypothetical protein